MTSRIQSIFHNMDELLYTERNNISNSTTFPYDYKYITSYKTYYNL